MKNDGDKEQVIVRQPLTLRRRKSWLLVPVVGVNYTCIAVGVNYTCIVVGVNYTCIVVGINYTSMYSGGR